MQGEEGGKLERGDNVDVGRTARNVLPYDLGGSSDSSVGGELCIANRTRIAVSFGLSPSKQGER
jgi:hypothetical protein